MSYRAHLTGLCVAVVCALGVLAPSTRANAQATAIAPYFLLVVDNSGSMGTSTFCTQFDGTTAGQCTGMAGCTWFASSNRCAATVCANATTMAACNAVGSCAWNNATTQCRGDGPSRNSCGQTRTRINDARCVMQQVVNAYGDVEFGLMRYNEAVTGTCAAPNPTYLDCTGCANSGGGCPAVGATAAQGQLLSPIVPQGGAGVERWADFTCTTGWDSLTAGSNPELRAETFTPIAGTVRGARSYYEGTGLYSTVGGAALSASPLTGSTIDQTCRPVNLVFLTDGEETCASDAATVAAIDELYASTAAGVAPRHILSYFIGFGMAGPDPYIESFATHGGTDAPGANRGFYAADETSLALAFSQIIADSILVERCDNIDNDCDIAVDEGFTRYCNMPSHPVADLCVRPAETLCDGVDNNCDGQIDEGLRNACNTCGAVPLETCNNLDDDCDTIIDEGVCGGCMPSVEICDNRDNDCNGVVDNITRPCGVMVGVCTVGTQLCTAGVWGTCSGRGPTA